MSAPEVTCTIERRLLVNFRIDPEVLARQLPAGLRPQLVGDSAVGGICFLRLGHLRTRHLPRALGLRTENMAHRFAVTYEDETGTKAGVFVPRRDTNSAMASLSGGFVFPGRYHRARFEISEGATTIEIGVISRDDSLRVQVSGSTADDLSGTLFETVDDALAFFKAGGLSYSPSRFGGCLDGVELISERWNARLVQLENVYSSVFEDRSRFPKGSVVYDSALLMSDLPARFVSRGIAAQTVPERQCV